MRKINRQFLKKFVVGGDLRTSTARKNIVFSFFLKGISIVISFLLVPLTINYLNTDEYGIWLTLSSILTWINFFDIGLGNGLRNKLAETFAVGDKKMAQVYVSTTFALLTGIMLLFFITFVIVNNFLHWDKILNTNLLSGDSLGKLVIIVFAFFCLQFVFKTVGTILIADQKSAYSDLLSVIGNLLSLSVIYVLTKITTGNLAYVAVVFSAAPVLVFLVACPVLFRGKYAFLRPKISAVQFTHTKSLIGLGVQFFIIQLAVCIVIYSSTNIILIQLFGSESVTAYNIAFRYFNAISMAYMIVIMPFWSASTDAYARNDLDWIRLSLKKLLVIFAGTMIVLVLMVLLANPFYKIWVGSTDVVIPASLSIVVALYTVLYNWSNTFIYFINGIGKIRLQLYLTVAVAIVYVPVAVWMGKLWGVNGVVLASAISLIPTSIFMPMQCVKLYKNKAIGIWKK